MISPCCWFSFVCFSPCLLDSFLFTVRVFNILYLSIYVSLFYLLCLLFIPPLSLSSFFSPSPFFPSSHSSSLPSSSPRYSRRKVVSIRHHVRDEQHQDLGINGALDPRHTYDDALCPGQVLDDGSTCVRQGWWGGPWGHIVFCFSEVWGLDGR